MRKAGPPRDMPPPLELECLKALWTLGHGTVHQVRQALAGERTLAYTTVLTVLDRLEKRGAVTRRKQGLAFVYAPKVTRDALRDRAVKRLAADFFDGSVDALAAYLKASAARAREDADTFVTAGS